MKMALSGDHINSHSSQIGQVYKTFENPDQKSVATCQGAASLQLYKFPGMPGTRATAH